MSEINVPRLGPDVRKRVAMPRFRRKQVPAIRLTAAVHKVLLRAMTNPKNFGVFVLEGRIVLSSLDTIRFQQLEERWPDQLIGTYGPAVTVTDLVDDLKEHFAEVVG